MSARPRFLANASRNAAAPTSSPRAGWRCCATGRPHTPPRWPSRRPRSRSPTKRHHRNNSHDHHHPALDHPPSISTHHREPALGGFAGLGFWELFSAVPTAWFAEFPLEPPELVKSLFSHQLGLTLSTPVAKLLHFLTGFLFYPLGYYALTRFVKSFGMPADGWIWGVITYFIALGFFAPLAGQAFLLTDVPRLSLMSLIGH